MIYNKSLPDVERLLFGYVRLLLTFDCCDTRENFAFDGFE